MTLLDIIKKQFNIRVYSEGVVRIEKVLSILSEEEVWYRPNPDTNSVGHLILHLCGNVNQWIGSGIGGQIDMRQRDREFHTDEHITKKKLIQLLHALRPVTDEALAMIRDEAQLTSKKSVQGFAETNLSILIHVIEHFSYHVGQIAVIAKYLKGVDLGFYEDIDLNIKN